MRKVKTEMKVTTERLDNCQVNVIVELDAAEIDKKMRETARKLSRQFAIPGYRKGKAPFYAVVRTFGREALQQQVLEEFGNQWYEQALEQIDYEPYDTGQLEEVEWDPFRMIVRLPIEPEVDLGDYRSVRVPFEVPEITEEQVGEVLAEYQEQFSTWVPVERPAALGDQVVLDMRGVVGETEVMNNEEYEMVLEAGAGYPLPGFHEQIVGLSAGEEKTFTLTMPTEGEDPEVAGQEATITVKLHSVKEKDVPPLDDDLAMMVGDYDTLDELKAATRESLAAKAQQAARSEYGEKVLEAIIEGARIEYPPQAVDREVEISLEQMEQSLASSGITMERFLALMGKTRDAYKQELRPSAEVRLKKRLALLHLAQAEGLTVEDDEIEAAIEQFSRSAGDQAGQVRQALDTPQGRASITNDLLIGQAMERVIQIGLGEAPPLEEPEETGTEGEPADEETAAVEPGVEEAPAAEETAAAEPEAPEAVETTEEEAASAESETSEAAEPVSDSPDESQE